MPKEKPSLESRCAHVIFYKDDSEELQRILIESTSGSASSGVTVSSFPSRLVPGTDRTLLMASAKLGRYECCKLLLSLDSAASVNVQTEQGYTALHYASYQGHGDVAFLLLAAGANVDIKNMHGETAYDSAVSGKRMDLVRWYEQSAYFAEQLALKTALENQYKVIITAHQQPLITVGDIEGNDNDGVGKNSVRCNQDNISVEPYLSRYEASLFRLHVTSVDKGGSKSVLGLEFPCLSVGGLDTASQYDDVYIGRASSNHIHLCDLSLSKQHAVLSYVEPRGYVLHDLGSKHGTFINDRRIGMEVVDKEKVEHPPSPSSSPSTFVVGAISTTTMNAPAGEEVSEEQRKPPAFVTEGDVLRFGRVHCQLKKTRQDAVVSSGFQPSKQLNSKQHETGSARSAQGNELKQISGSSVEDHRTAVNIRLRQLYGIDASSSSTSMARKGSSHRSNGSMNNCNEKNGRIIKATNTSAISSDRTTGSLKTNSTAASAAAVEAAGAGTGAGTTGTTGTTGTGAGTGADVLEKGQDLLQRLGWQTGVALGKRGGSANAPIDVHRQASAYAGVGIAPAVGTDVTGAAVQESAKQKHWRKTVERFNQQHR